MEQKKVVAVIGCGRIASNAHLPAFAKMSDVYIKYVCDIIPEKAEKVKNAYPGLVGEAVSDYKTVLKDKEVEGVFILTPNNLHYDIAMDALKAGKHVFCEKPVAVNYNLALAMVKQAEKSGKLLNIGVCNRYNKSVEILEKLNKDGFFGNIYHVYCSFRSYRCIPGLGGAFTDKAQSGGGVLIDWGIHFLDLILYILGSAKLKSVTCNAYNEMAKDMNDYKYTFMWAEDTKKADGINDVDDFVSGFIRTDKAGISFNGAWAQNIAHDEMFIDFMGDKGGARLNYGGHFTLYTQDEVGGLKTVQYQYNIPDQYECENRAFLAAMTSGEKTKTHINNILESAKLLDALYRSSAEEKEIIL